MLLLCHAPCLGQKDLSHLDQKDSSHFIALVSNHAITNKDIVERIKFVALMSGATFSPEFVQLMYKQTAYQMLDEVLLEEKIKQLSKISPKYFGKKMMEKLAHQRESVILKKMKTDKKAFSRTLQEKGIPYYNFYHQIRAQACLEHLLDARYNIHDSAKRIAKKAIKKQKKEQDKSEYLYEIAEIVIYNQNPFSKQSAENIMASIKAGESFQSLASRYSQSLSRLSGGKLSPLFESQIDPAIRPHLRKCEEGSIIGPIPVPQNNPIRFVILAVLSKEKKGAPNQNILQNNIFQQHIGILSQEEKNRIRKEIYHIIRIPKVYLTKPIVNHSKN